MKLNEAIVKRIREICDEKGLSVCGAALGGGKSPSALYDLVKGRTQCSKVVTIQRFARARILRWLNSLTALILRILTTESLFKSLGNFKGPPENVDCDILHEPGPAEFCFQKGPLVGFGATPHMLFLKARGRSFKDGGAPPSRWWPWARGRLG